MNAITIRKLIIFLLILGTLLVITIEAAHYARADDGGPSPEGRRARGGGANRRRLAARGKIPGYALRAREGFPAFLAQRRGRGLGRLRVRAEDPETGLALIRID